MRSLVLSLIAACTLTAPLNVFAADEPAKPSPLQDSNFFPLCVWVQAPSNAAKYRAAGVNTYVGLWKGPTDEQLAELKQSGMHLICHQNATALKHKNDPMILAWMHGDEPDNAQAKRGGGYGPPIAAEKIVEDYKKLKETDPSRPVLLNLGQGVAWDNYIGRGVRRNHPEDYPEYVKGCDIASFDIYPACHDHKEVAGKLWFVADGVSRLKKWTGDRQQVWNCIECTRISNPDAKATPQQVKAEVWMSIVRGSRGIIYFCHQFKPNFIEAGMLADADMVAGITNVNQQIKELAAVINSPSLGQGLTVTSSNTEVPVEAVLKQHGDSRYVFAVGMRDGMTRATFRLEGAKGSVEVLGEDRRIDIKDGAFDDEFRPWDVHLYRVP
jgi:hypothetical protein